VRDAVSVRRGEGRFPTAFAVPVQNAPAQNREQRALKEPMAGS
jgi:hypothetical protein